MRPILREDMYSLFGKVSAVTYINCLDFEYIAVGEVGFFTLIA